LIIESGEEPKVVDTFRYDDGHLWLTFVDSRGSIVPIEGAIANERGNWDPHQSS